MSKSGSRYGRRSNWFKIHCLLQEQQQAASQHYRQQRTPPPALSVLGQRAQHMDPRLHHQLATAMSQHQALQVRTKEDLLMLGLDEYKNSTSPSISSPESHNSDTSVEVSETRLLAGGGLFLNNNNNTKCPAEQRPGSNTKDMFVPLPFAFPHPATFFPPSQHSAFMFPHSSFLYHQQPPKSHQSVLKNNNNNNNNKKNGDAYSKRFFLDAILRSQQSPSGGSTSREDEDDEDDDDEEETTEAAASPKHQPTMTRSTNKGTILTMSRILASPHHEDHEQENPMDLSMKGCQHDYRLSPSPAGLVDDVMSDQEEEDGGELSAKGDGQDVEYDSTDSDHKERHSRNVAAPMDLTTRA
ncbi:Protein embryonic gonad [Zootermopsis nevadensis]|uniref:Protein embryonic gonad n=2 Tax=Zootermopsis nevadensis TaxID=136037 RepID=A0A067R2X2_ZOONE|nr:Protein embryonic gonad [Zootermopsis nevadensis]